MPDFLPVFAKSGICFLAFFCDRTHKTLTSLEFSFVKNLACA
ncbi:hypothetical protein CYK57_01928 [Actinobacillus pleuropneumoniae]|nr:hypothetical protein CYK57_01928 [Actinobacillus pleuropneumoniae]